MRVSFDILAIWWPFMEMVAVSGRVWRGLGEGWHLHGQAWHKFIDGRGGDTLRSDLIGQSVFLRLLEILWSNFDTVRLVYE